MLSRHDTPNTTGLYNRHKRLVDAAINRFCCPGGEGDGDTQLNPPPFKPIIRCQNRGSAPLLFAHLSPASSNVERLSLGSSGSCGVGSTYRAAQAFGTLVCNSINLAGIPCFRDGCVRDGRSTSIFPCLQPSQLRSTNQLVNWSIRRPRWRR